MIKQITKPARCFERVHEQMLSIIQEGEWKEGQRIPGEETLAQEFGVSRNSLRTAIKVLHSADILESRPGLGTFVTAEALNNIRKSHLVNSMQKDHNYDDILDARFILEKETAYLAALRRTDKEVVQLESLRKKVEDAVKKNEREKAISWGGQFHLQIVKMTHNKLLQTIYESLLVNVSEEKKNSLTHESDEVFRDVYSFFIKRDKAIVQAIKDRDAPLARELVEEHVTQKKDVRTRKA